MSKNAKWIVIVILAAILIGTALIYGRQKPAGPGPLDAFAKCLDQKGAKFYGAFWCPHCQNQKKMFGTSEQFLPYVECSTADGGSELPVCIQKNITGYPTWEFADGSRLTGKIQLQTLAQKTGCSLPAGQ